jgi:hypothetical protein
MRLLELLLCGDDVSPGSAEHGHQVEADKGFVLDNQHYASNQL